MMGSALVGGAVGVVILCVCISEYLEYKRSEFIKQNAISFRQLIQDKDCHLQYKIYTSLERCKECHYLLTEVKVPNASGEIYIIPLVMLTQKGIFVVEIEQRKGLIYGEAEHSQWIQFRSKKKQLHFQNPIYRSLHSMKALNRVLEMSVPMQGFIVFSAGCDLKRVEEKYKNIETMHPIDVYNRMDKALEKMPRILTEKEVKEMYAKIHHYQQNDFEGREELGKRKRAQS